MKAQTTLITLLIVTLLFPILSCTSVNSQKRNDVSANSKEFKEYWYSGKAELTRYELQQSRYGEIHKGDAVLIFVTEDFDTDQQVKHERGDRENAVSVLKLNFTRKFFTGIYPYSMMSSTFTPVDSKKPTLKVTTSSQEWCGHTFSQLNFRNNQYRGSLYSYFQDEGDREFSLEKALLEDEIWAMIRLRPSALPVGDVQLIPGTMFLRLKHQDFGVENAKASLVNTTDQSLSEKDLKKYSIAYNDFNRVLEITFESEFPYTIVSWEERGQGGPDGKELLTTRAVRTHSINTAYWGQHNLADAGLRKQLGLDLNNY